MGVNWVVGCPCTGNLCCFCGIVYYFRFALLKVIMVNVNKHLMPFHMMT